MIDSYVGLGILILTDLVVNVILIIRAIPLAVRRHRIGAVSVLTAFTVMFLVEGLSMSCDSPPFSVSTLTRASGSQFGPLSIQRALLCIGLFQAAFMLGNSLRVPVFRRVLRARLATPRRFLYPLSLIGFAPLVSIYGVAASPILQEILSSRTRRPNADLSEAGWTAYVSSIALYPVAVLVANGMRGRGLLRWCDLLVGLFGAVPFLAYGSRHQLIFVGIPAVLVWFYDKVRRINFRTLAASGLAAVLLLVVLQTQLAVRYKGWTSIGDIDAGNQEWFRPSAMFETLLFTTSLVPEVYDYFKEPMTPFFVTYFVPRRWWPAKPESRSYVTMSEAWTGTANINAYNVPPSVIGQYYSNWSYIGVLMIGLWIGMLCKGVDRHAELKRVEGRLAFTVLCGGAYALLINFLRLYYPFYLMYFMYMVATAILVSKLDTLLPVQRRKRA